MKKMSLATVCKHNTLNPVDIKSVSKIKLTNIW